MSHAPLESTAVVTVTYNSSAVLEPFLASVRAAEDGGLAVVVVDNRSDDIEETRAIAAAHRASLLELDENRGYGGAVNEAVNSLPESIDFVLISNPDVMIGDKAISTLARRLETEPSVAAIGPKVLNADDSVYPSARQLPSLRTGIGHALFSEIWPANPWTSSYRADREGADHERTVGWLSGSCVLVRRSAFAAIGGFDEGYFMYFEDVDLGYRFGKSGWKNLYLPNAQVTHSGAHSTSTESGTMLRVHHDSAYRYLNKKYAGPVLAPLRLTLRIGLATRAWYLARAARRSDLRRTG